MTSSRVALTVQGKKGHCSYMGNAIVFKGGEKISQATQGVSFNWSLIYIKSECAIKNNQIICNTMLGLDIREKSLCFPFQL